MPVNRKIMKSMKEQYGSKKGEDIYYAVEQKQKKRSMAKALKQSAKKKDK